jgi:hypothetical protein
MEEVPDYTELEKDDPLHVERENAHKALRRTSWMYFAVLLVYNVACVICYNVFVIVEFQYNYSWIGYLCLGISLLFFVLAKIFAINAVGYPIGLLSIAVAGYAYSFLCYIGSDLAGSPLIMSFFVITWVLFMSERDSKVAKALTFIAMMFVGLIFCAAFWKAEIPEAIFGLLMSLCLYASIMLKYGKPFVAIPWSVELTYCVYWFFETFYVFGYYIYKLITRCTKRKNKTSVHTSSANASAIAPIDASQHNTQPLTSPQQQPSQTSTPTSIPFNNLQPTS